MAGADRYDDGFEMSDAAACWLGSRLMALRPLSQERQEARYAIRLVQGRPFNRLPDFVEGGTFWDQFGDRRESRRQAWQDYRHRTFAFVALEREEAGRGWTPVGTLRIIAGGKPVDFKSLVNMEKIWPEEGLVQRITEEYQPSWTKVWDVATLAIRHSVKRKAGGRLLVYAMLNALVQYGRPLEIELLLGILAKETSDSLHHVRFEMIHLTDIKEYDGVESHACLIPAKRALEDLEKVRESKTARRILNSEGLGGIFDVNLVPV